MGAALSVEMVHTVVAAVPGTKAKAAMVVLMVAVEADMETKTLLLVVPVAMAERMVEVVAPVAVVAVGSLWAATVALMVERAVMEVVLPHTVKMEMPEQTLPR